MPYTLAEAAKATGTNKTTILRAIRSGKITGTKDDHGSWQIEPAELHRIYPRQSYAPMQEAMRRNDTHQP